MSNEEMSQIGKGALVSPEDYRYVNLEHLAGAAPSVGALPESFHIDYKAIPDLYQRKIGACTAHATVEAVMRRQQRLTGSFKRLSPRFTYALSKITDGVLNTEGTYPNLPLKLGVKFGYATLDTCPNDTELTFDKYVYGRTTAGIPEAAFDEAIENRIPGYAQVGSFNNVTESQIKQALMKSDGVKACLKIGSEWWTRKDGVSSWLSKDILPIRKTVSPESGHDIVLTGWETLGGRCKIFFRNHWSLNWADQDTGWFYLDEHPLTEAWIISEIPDPLLAIIKNLPAKKDFSYKWNVDFAPGAQGPDVENLQIALKILGAFPFPQPITTYFGGITKAAVMQFQADYKVASPAEIASAGGKLGPKTRGILNKMFGGK